MSLVRYNGLLAIPQEIGAEASARGHKSAEMRKKQRTNAGKDDDEEATLPKGPRDTSSVTDDLPWDEVQYESKLAAELAKLSTTDRPAKFKSDSTHSVVLINPVSKLQFQLNFNSAEKIEANDLSSLFAIDASRMKRGISQSCFNAPVSQAELNALDLNACHILFPEFLTRDLDVRAKALSADSAPDSGIKALQQRLRLFKDLRIACDKSINKLQSEIHNLEASDLDDDRQSRIQSSEPSLPAKPALQELFEDITTNMLNQDQFAAALHSHTISMMEFYRQGLVCMALHCKKVSKEIEARFKRLIETLFAVQEEIISYGNFELTPSKVVSLTEGLHVCTCESCTAVPAGGAMKAEYERRMASKLLAAVATSEAIEGLDDASTAANVGSGGSTKMSNQRLFAVIDELKEIVVEMDCSPADALSRYNDQMEKYQRSITTPKRSITDIDRVSINVALEDGKFPLPPTLEQVNMLVAANANAPVYEGEAESLNTSTNLTPETANQLLATLSNAFPNGPSNPSQESLIKALKDAADGKISKKMHHFSIGNGSEEDTMSDAEKDLWKSGAMLDKQIASTEQLHNQHPEVYMSPAEEALYFKLRGSAPPLPAIIVDHEVVGDDLNLLASFKTDARFARPNDAEYSNKYRDAPPPYEYLLMSADDVRHAEEEEVRFDTDAFLRTLNTIAWPGDHFKPPLDVFHRPLCTDENFNLRNYWAQQPEDLPLSDRRKALLQQILTNGARSEDDYLSDDDEATKARKQKSRLERAGNCKGNMPASVFESIFQRMRAYPNESFASDGQYYEAGPEVATKNGTRVALNASKFSFNGNWDVSIGLGKYIPAEKADEYMLSLLHNGVSNKRVSHLYVKQLARLRIDVYKAGIEWIRGRMASTEGDVLLDLSSELEDTKRKLEWATEALGRIEELCIKYPLASKYKPLSADSTAIVIQPEP